MSFTDPPQIHVSVTRRVSDGNFGSYEVTMGVSKLPYNATEDEIAMCMGTAKLTTTQVVAELRDRIGRIRGEGIEL